MSEEFSGEQKLRIVLESIIRNVPKGEQSKKYGVSEEEFQSWHDHLIQNGGKIFDQSQQYNSKSRHVKKKMGPLAKLFLIFSLFTNLGLLIFGIVYLLNNENKKEELVEAEINSIDSPVNLVDRFPDAVAPPTEGKKEEAKDADIEVMLENARVKPLPSKSQDNNIENLLAQPGKITIPSLIPPVVATEPENEVTFLGRSYEGRHVVYLLDVGTYILDGNDSVEQFNQSKEALVSSIITLSPNSYFNLVLYWNLRETAALGKTILKASQENKKYAIDWITSLGDNRESLKVDRNQYYPKELLYAKPIAGIIGPWYGLSTAISFDPDLVFVLAGNLPEYDRSEVPRSHYEGLGKVNFEKLQSGENLNTNINALSRETARKWFYAITPITSLPANEEEVEKMALTRLGFTASDQGKPVYTPLAWDKAFETFLSGLEVGFDRIPQTHVMLSLPKYVSWPSPLLNSVREFTESSRGSFSLNPFLP